MLNLISKKRDKLDLTELKVGANKVGICIQRTPHLRRRKNTEDEVQQERWPFTKTSLMETHQHGQVHAKHKTISSEFFRRLLDYVRKSRLREALYSVLITM